MLKSLKKTKTQEHSFTDEKKNQNPEILNYFLSRQTHETPEKTEKRDQFQYKQMILMLVWNGKDKSASQRWLWQYRIWAVLPTPPVVQANATS